MSKFTGTILVNFEAADYSDAQAQVLAALAHVTQADLKKLDLSAWDTPAPVPTPLNT